MKRNIGVVDGLIRAGLGIGAFVLAFAVVEGFVDGVIEALGGALIITAVLGYCPVYNLLGISTNKDGNP